MPDPLPADLGPRRSRLTRDAAEEPFGVATSPTSRERARPTIWPRAAAEQGEPEGTSYVAGAQTAGRGRLGRTWFSPPDAGPVRLGHHPTRARSMPWVTLAAGVAWPKAYARRPGCRCRSSGPTTSCRRGVGVLAAPEARRRSGRGVDRRAGVQHVDRRFRHQLGSRIVSAGACRSRRVDRRGARAGRWIAGAVLARRARRRSIAPLADVEHRRCRRAARRAGWRCRPRRTARRSNGTPPAA